VFGETRFGSSEGERTWACTHKTRRATRPLFPQKLTFYSAICMSALCQNLKSRVHFVGIGTGKKRPASRPTFRFTPARGGRAGADEVRRKSERERAEYAREGEVLIDSETPEDTEDRAAQLRRGPGRQRLRIQSADNFVKLGASQSDRMFVVRCSSWP
jgi:hypothetical protein